MTEGIKDRVMEVLTRAQLDRIHEASLKVLAERGLSTDSDLILKTFADAGAKVDRDSNRMRIPRGLVENSIRTAPALITLYGRDPANDIEVGGKSRHFGLGGSPTPRFRDFETGQIRTPTKSDVVRATVLGDALDNIDFIMSLAGAYDFAGEMHYLHEYDALLSNTTKPIVYSAPSSSLAVRFLEMAAAAAGGQEQLEKRPIVTLFAESQSPLCLPRYAEGMVEFARLGAPILFSPSPMMGATSPVTLSGNLVVGNSETLAGVCLAQILRPGTPVIYGPHTPVMDMRTTRSTYGAVEQALARAAVAQLARFYELPSWGTGAGTDSKYPDSQAGSEVTMNIFSNALAGINLSQGVGTMAGGSYGCLTMAVICDEVIGMSKRFTAGIAVDDESLALDLIDQVGPGGHFLEQRHTAALFRRELYIPKLFDRQTEALWSRMGSKTIDEVAGAKVGEILENHKPQGLSAAARKEMDYVLEQSGTARE